MSYCHYHPVQAATFKCSDCGREFCDRCVDVDRRTGVRCYQCQKPAESLGARNTAEPFWRRLQQTFHYPKKPETIVLLVLISFFSTLSVLYLPLGFIWALMMTGAFIKYCMSALEKTALGSMEPPDITDAYGGGISLLLQLLFLLFALGAMVAAGAWLLGPTFAGLLGVAAVVILPAMLINFAMTESIWQAINPASAVQLIKAVGLPYGLLLALILVMMSSMGLLSSLFGAEPGLWSVSIQSLVSNYYLLVTCHLMGYMLFQYQHELGFSAREDEVSDLPVPSERERLTVKIDHSLKDGNFDEVLTLLSKGLRQYPDDTELFDQGFDFLTGSRNLEQLPIYAERYFTHLKASDRLDKVRAVFKRIQLLLPKYLPESPISRHIIAKSCFDAGDFKTVVLLLNSMHKQYPEYFDLPSAYELLAKALEQLPKLSGHAQQYRTMAEKLKTRKKTKAQDPASFSVSQELPKKPAVKKQTKPNRPTPKSALGSGLSLAPIETPEKTPEASKPESEAQELDLLVESKKAPLAKPQEKSEKPMPNQAQKPRVGGPDKGQSLEDIFAARAQDNHKDGL